MMAKGIFGKSYANTIVKTYDIGDISENDVIVKVKSALLCGSDIQFLKYSTDNFHALGHEIAGVIVDKGKNVKDFQINDAVAVKTSISCKKCRQCILGNESYCQNIISYDDMPGFSDFIKVNSRALFKADGLSFNEIASIEILATSVEVVSKFDNISNSNIAIIGTGPLGILTAKVAKIFGAKTVTVIGNLPTTPQSAKRHQMFVDMMIGEVSSYTDVMNMKFDCIFDLIPASNMQFDISHCQYGGTIVLAGYTFGQERGTIYPTDIVFNKLTIRSAMSDPKMHFDEAAKMILDKKIDIAKLITDYCNFDNFSFMIKNIVNKSTPTVKLCFRNE